MPNEFRLPADIASPDAEGVIVHWFKDAGQTVRKGDLLLEVQFEKVTTEVYAPADGVLTEILVGTGETFRSAQALCLLTGAAPPAVASEPPRLSLSATQRIAGERMMQSLRESAQYTLGREVNVTALMALRSSLKARGSAVTVSDLIHGAVLLALADHPQMQARLDGDSLLLPGGVGLGFAVARGGDLLVPVIASAHRLTLAELAAERVRLTEAVLSGGLQASDLAGGTFTVSNLGAYGVDFFTPVLNPPQPAILGVGRVVERPVFRRGAVEPAEFLTLSLTVDHRLINGAPAGAFLARVAELLTEPGVWASDA